MTEESEFEIMGRYIGSPAKSNAKDEVVERLRDLDQTELFRLACDKNQVRRVRWVALANLDPSEARRLTDELLLRFDDEFLPEALQNCVPTHSEAAVELLKQHREASPKLKDVALSALVRLGDETAVEEAAAMLTAEDSVRHRLAITCIGQSPIDVSTGLLLEYMRDGTNSLELRLEAAIWLLHKGVDVVPFLELTAKGHTEEAFRAARTIENNHDRRLGLQLIDAILQIDDHPASPLAVLTIFSNHGFEYVESTTAQLKAARTWIAAELAKLEQES